MPDMSNPRSVEDIEHAHDLLISLLLAEADEMESLLGTEVLDNMVICADVLCWVLGHDHNPIFADKLRNFAKFAKLTGLVEHECEIHNSQPS
jgi:hypothetical protein